jgi:acylphosphatase
MRVFLVVHGIVQDVGYRALVQRIAYKHGVAGYVRNDPDGSVFVGVDGDREAVDAFIKDIDVSIGRIQVFKIERVAEAPRGEEGINTEDGFVIR